MSRHRRPRRRRIVPLMAVTLAASGLAAPAHSAGALPSFPGAEGFGATTPGGRGGKVIAVTNLNDSGPGSLRAAVEAASGPRIVVFRTGGTITLKDSIHVRNPNVTIAGQTAPGGGISLRLDPSQDAGLFDVQTHDVIIRGMRFRQGAHTNIDAAIPLEVKDASRVVIDHNSISWATDEVLTTYDNTSDITISWNVISEGLSHSTHYEGEHSRGLFISGDNSRNVTAHHNLIAHNMRRSPEVSTNGISDIRNNVVYNWGTHATLVSDKRSSPGMNVVGNYYKAGPSTSASREEIDGYAKGPGMKLYAKDNVTSKGTAARLDSDAQRWLTSTPLPAPEVTTTSAQQAYTDVLAGAGARWPSRDAVDVRILGDVRNGTGRIIDDPSQVGGWPTLAKGTAPADGDDDGMPDDWETAHGLNPSADDSAADKDGDGYTNVEEYVNGLITSAGSAPAAATSTSTSTAAATPTATATPTASATGTSRPTSCGSGA